MYTKKCLTVNFISMGLMLIMFLVVFGGCGKNGFGQKLFGIEADTKVIQLGGVPLDIEITGDSFGIHKSMISGLQDAVTICYKAHDGTNFVGIPMDGSNTGTGGAYVETEDEILFYRLASYYPWATHVRIEYTVWQVNPNK